MSDEGGNIREIVTVVYEYHIILIQEIIREQVKLIISDIAKYHKKCFPPYSWVIPTKKIIFAWHLAAIEIARNTFSRSIVVNLETVPP